MKTSNGFAATSSVLHKSTMTAMHDLIMKQQHPHSSESVRIRLPGTGKAENSTLLCIHIVGLEAVFAKEG